MIVAMPDSLNVLALDDLKLSTNCEIDPVLVSSKEIDAAIQKAYNSSFLNKKDEGENEITGIDTSFLNLGALSEDSDSLSVKLSNSIIK